MDCCNHHCSLQSHLGGGAQWIAPESCNPARSYQQLPIHPKHINRINEDILLFLYIFCFRNQGQGPYKTHRCKLGLFSIFVSEMEKISFSIGLKPKIREGHLTLVVQRCLEWDALWKRTTFWASAAGKDREKKHSPGFQTTHRTQQTQIPTELSSQQPKLSLLKAAGC